MSPVVCAVMARYRALWTDQLAEALVARRAAALERPWSLVAYLIAQDHVAAVARIIDELPS